MSKCGVGTYLSKIDLADAFKHILVREEDWKLLGCTVTDATGRLNHYAKTVLPFGLRSSPCLFNKYANALEYIMQQNGITSVVHYIDDYVTWHTSLATCQRNFDIMLQTCDMLGFSVQPSKVVPPSTCTEILGIVIDTQLQQLRISSERLTEIMSELQVWNNKRSTTKRKLLSIVGKLSFVAKVVRCGRTFTRRLIELSKKPKYLHHRVRLNKAARSDIKWWLDYLPVWNGVSYFAEDTWTSNKLVNFWTDASDWGCGGTYGHSWFSLDYSKNSSWLTRPIAWRELYAVVVAAATWCNQLRGKRILYHCDNSCVVHILNSGTSRDTNMMGLIRQLFFISAHNGFEWHSVHLTSKENRCADCLSRGDITNFFTIAPEMNLHMDIPMTISLQDE